MDWLGGGHIKGLIHKFYPKMNDSCLGLQLHWCPIRLETSWVLQLSNRFHKTLLVKSSPPQCGTQPRTYPSELQVALPSARPLNRKGAQGVSSSHCVLIFIGLILFVHLSFARYSQWRLGSREHVYFNPKWPNQWHRSLRKAAEPTLQKFEIALSPLTYDDERLQKPDLISKLKT